MLLPAGSKSHDRASNRVVFRLTGHTAQSPRLVILDRKDPNSGGYSTMTIKVVRGVTDSEGVVRNNTITYSVRNVPGQLLADITAVNNVLRHMLGSANFDSDVGVELALPADADVTP